MALSCRQAQKLIPLCHDGAFAGVGAVEEHLRTCTACKTEMAVWQAIATALGKMEAPAPPADFTGRIMARVEAAEQGNQDAYPGHPAWRKLLTFSRPVAGVADGYRLRPGLARWAAAAAVLIVMASGSWSLAARFWLNNPATIVAEQPKPGPRLAPPELPPVSAPEKENSSGSSTPQAQAEVEASGTPTKQGEGSGPTGPAKQPEPGEVPRGSVAAHQVAQQQAAAPAPYGSQVFLDKERQITSSLLKVKVADLAAAEASAHAGGRVAGAEVQELARGQQQLGLKFTVSVDRANNLLTRLICLGKVTDQGSETRDVTADFAANLELYRYWVGLRNTASNSADVAAMEKEIARLEKQLTAWEQEASKQIIVLWLEEE